MRSCGRVTGISSPTITSEGGQSVYEQPGGTASPVSDPDQRRGSGLRSGFTVALSFSAVLCLTLIMTLWGNYEKRNDLIGTPAYCLKVYRRTSFGPEASWPGQTWLLEQLHICASGSRWELGASGKVTAPLLVRLWGMRANQITRKLVSPNPHHIILQDEPCWISGYWSRNRLSSAPLATCKQHLMINWPQLRRKGVSEWDRQTGRQTDRQTDRQTESEENRETGKVSQRCCWIKNVWKATTKSGSNNFWL